MTKICTQCGIEKDRFPRQRAGRDGFSSWCRDCYSVFQKQWRKDNKERNKKTQRKAYLKKMFGITPEIYERMFAEQNGRCSICETHQTELTKILGVDHSHVTGQVRGLLCSGCNAAIGLLKDSPLVLEKAITYLQRFV